MLNIYTVERKGYGWRAAVTHCVKGHEYTPQNTRWRDYGARVCRECDLARKREAYRRERAA